MTHMILIAICIASGSESERVSVWQRPSILTRTNTRQHHLYGSRIWPSPSINMPHPSLPALSARAHKPLISFIGKRIWPSCVHTFVRFPFVLIPGEQHSHQPTRIRRRHPSIARRFPASCSRHRKLLEPPNNPSGTFGMHQPASGDQSTTNYKNSKSMPSRYAAKQIPSFRKTLTTHSERWRFTALTFGSSHNVL